MTNPEVSELLEIEEAGKWRPGDHLAQIWPSDEWSNISAAARVAAKGAAIVFRNELARSESKS